MINGARLLAIESAVGQLTRRGTVWRQNQDGWCLPMPRHSWPHAVPSTVWEIPFILEENVLSKKSFGGNKRNFLKLLLRFVRSDVRETTSLLRKTTTDLRIDTKEHRNGGGCAC